MILTQPIWLVLLIPLGLAWWIWPAPTRPLRVLRALLIGAVVLAMCGPALRLSERAGTVVVVADRSRSMPPDAERLQRETIELIDRARGDRDRLAVVAFGQRAVVEQPPDVGTFEHFSQSVGADASNLGEAIDRALSLLPEGESARLLVLSDGLWTGADPRRAASRAAARGVAIDYRVIERGQANDVAIERIESPRQLNHGESFMLHAHVRSPRAQRLDYTLYRNGQPLGRGQRQLSAGLTRLSFRDQAEAGGVYQYELRVQVPEDDPLPENNRARWFVDVAGARPVLVVTESHEPALARLLERGGLDVRWASPDAVDWSLAGLDSYAAIILENVPAWTLPREALQTVSAWVQRHGGGLVMTGGERSFGPGGYFDSPLAASLPVSMELRQEHRKLAMAILVALDRSGSMGMTVGGGRSKMELANLGTAKVLDMLTPLDEFGVLAVDTRPHVIAPMQRVPSDPTALRERVLRMESMGGGIYIYEALSAAYEMLRDTDAGTRHLILFSDAADSVRPGRYRELLEAYEREGITVSVIGLGTRADKDAALLDDVARRGGGRIFFTADPHRLPELFAEDMVVVARSAFVRDPTPVRLTAALTPLVGRSLTDPPVVEGYNLTYLREGATPMMVTADEFAAPFVATWQAGLGRTAVYTGEADGQYTGPISRWASIGEVMGSLVRWTAGDVEPLPETMMLRQEVERGMYRVSLELDPHRPDALVPRPPMVHTLHEQAEGEPEPRRTPMRWESADVLVAEVPIEADGAVLTHVMVPGHGRVRLGPVTLPYSPEFAPMPHDGRQASRQLARLAGGEQRTTLSSIWQAMERTVRHRPISHWMLFVAALTLLCEVFERRTGMLAGRWRRPLKVRYSRQPQGAPQVEGRRGDGGAAAPRSIEASTAAHASSPHNVPPSTPSGDPDHDTEPALGQALARARSQADRRHGRKR